MPTYEVDNTFNKSMFSQIIIGAFTDDAVWKSWGDTTIATYQGNPFGSANGTSSTRAYPWELDPASPSTSSPWHNIIYENCIGQYNWGARAFFLYFPFGGLNSSIFITPEILKRTHTVANPSGNNHDQPAIWKGFKYAIKALLEGTLAPTGKTAMTEHCNVMLYLTANRGDGPYVSRSTTFWNSLPGTSNEKDAKYYEYLDAMVDDIISMKSVSGGRLHIALDTVATSATPSSVAAFRDRFHYKTDALELSDWYVFNRLVTAGIPTFYEARTLKTITHEGVTYQKEWAGKAHLSGEYWNILSNPTHPYVDSNASQYVTDEDSEMTFRFLDPNFPPFPPKDPYGSIHEVVYEGKTRVFLQESMIGGTSYFTPHNSMFSYYMLSDHYRKYYNINTSTSTFSGVYLETPNIIGYDYTFISSGYQCLAAYVGNGVDPRMNYYTFPALGNHLRPPFEPGTGSGQWNGPGGHLAYNKGLWTQHGKDTWDAGVRGSSFADFITKLHDYSLVVGPKYNWFGVKYGSLADTLTRNVIDLVSPARVFTDFWASSWFSTDPAVTSMTTVPADIGNVNSYSLIKPMIHVHDCVGDGGYNNADGTPIANSLSNFLNASSGCGNRIDAIKTKLMEIPAEKRALKMTRYDQGHYYKNTDDAYGGSNLWAENLGAFLRDDWTTIATALKNAGCAPDYITMDCPPGESNIFFVFSDFLDTALITNIISDPNASLPWYGIKSFNNIYTNDGQYPLVFNEIFAEIRHAQYNRQYIWWEKAVSAVQTELLNEFIVKPTMEVFGISKVSNYDSTIVSEDTDITNLNGHPYFGETVVGDANSPLLYAAWNGHPLHSILNRDTTRIVRTDYGDANGGTTAFPATAWNQFLNLMQIMRGVKRKSPNIPIRPWIASIDFTGSSMFNPQWNTDSNSKSLYWESIRHFVMTGSDMIHYWNESDDTPDKLVKNCSKLNKLLEDINKRIGGYTLHQTNIARIDYLANYVISGVPVNNTYVWRVTPKPGVTLITSSGENLELDIDRGAWITTATATPPVFATENQQDAIYQVDSDLSRSMFATITLANPGNNPGDWNDWISTTVATYQGTPMTGTRAYPFETNPANPTVSSPWHNIIYENCIGPYNWGARAFYLYSPFGSSDEIFFLTPEISKRTYTETNTSANNHDQPAIWKGFRQAVKALLEGKLAPTGKTHMTDPCNVSIYLAGQRGDILYRGKSNDLWDSFSGSFTEKDTKYYEYLDAVINDLIWINNTTIGSGRLSISLEVTSVSATPSDISHWRSMPDYRTDSLELADWYVFNRLVDAGVATFYESRSDKVRNKAFVFGVGTGNIGLPLAVDWASKAFNAEEYWFWFSNPAVNQDMSHLVPDENAPAIFRAIMSHFPLPAARDPYGSIITATSNGKTKTLNINDLNVFTPQYAMWNYYMLSDHYRKYYNKNTSTSTFTGISATVENFMSYSPDLVCSTNLCISVFDGIQNPLLKYWSLPGAVVNYRPPFEPGTGSGQWNGPGGVDGYTGGYWLQSGKNKWDSDIRADSFAGFLTKLHNYSLNFGPIGSNNPYGSLSDTLTREVIVLV